MLLSSLAFCSTGIICNCAKLIVPSLYNFGINNILLLKSTHRGGEDKKENRGQSFSTHPTYRLGSAL